MVTRSRAFSRRRSFMGWAVLGLAGSMLAMVGPARADTTPPYAIDGSVPDSGISGTFADPYGSSQELGPVNGTATKLGVIHKAAPPMLALTNPNGQVDLRNIWLDTGKDPGGDTWLYIGWERDSSRGSGVLMYEFMQDAVPTSCDYEASPDVLTESCNPWENRQAGDFILVWDQVGSAVRIVMRAWRDTDPGPGENLVLSAGEELTGSGNAQAAVSSNGYFGEGAVNLTDTVFRRAGDKCLTFGNVVPGTVTGNSDTADYKDTVLANVSEFVNISNCGAVSVTKVTNPTGGTGAFDWALERTDGAAIRYAADHPGSDLTSASGRMEGHGSTETVTNLIAADDYTLDETIGVGSPYDKTSIVCTTESGTGYTLYSSAGGTSVPAFPVIEGETTDCVITNTLQPGTLVVEKVLRNDDGGTRTVGSFLFTVNGESAVPFDSDGRNEMSVAQGTYTVVERGLPIAGYATSYSNTANSNADCDELFVPAGGRVTCTITNDDVGGTLIVRKVVTNDNGGTSDVNDFSFRVNGGDPVAFDSDGEIELSVDAGTYTVVEDGLPIHGYGTTYENSAGTSADCSNLMVPLGGTVTCTITNDDQKASPSGTTVQAWTLHDELTITGLREGGSPSGTVTFRLYSDVGCTTLVGSEEDTTISGGAAGTTRGITVSDSGTYYWQAEYSGDSFNEGFITDCGEEITRILAKDQGRDDLAPPPA